MAVLEEKELLFMHCRRFVNEALLVLQFLKARGSCGDYLDAAADVAREVIRFAEEGRANLTDQHSWLTRQCSAGVLVPLQTDVTAHAYERLMGSLSADLRLA